MILGIGIDLLEIARIERIYTQFGDHFAQKILSDQEFAAFQQAVDPIYFLALRFAAKEACVKALGRSVNIFKGISILGLQENEWHVQIDSMKIPLLKLSLELSASKTLGGNYLLALMLAKRV